MSRIEQQGFLTIAQNNSDTDYLRLAYLQALSIKVTMPGSKYAVLVDSQTLLDVTDEHKDVFDYVIEIPTDYAKDDDWKLANEWQVFNLTPFKETIKLDSDLLFTRSIKHWWYAFRLNDVVLSQGCRNYKQELSDVREYRRVFDDNMLPDVYSGLMYFRYTQTGTDFFNVARELFCNWDEVSNHLKNCRDTRATTDLVYALAASIIGVEKCTLPFDFINFVHMKPEINKWANKPFQDIVVVETDLPMIRINNVNQYYPLHYQEKSFATDELIKEYEEWIRYQKHLNLSRK